MLLSCVDVELPSVPNESYWLKTSMQARLSTVGVCRISNALRGDETASAQHFETRAAVVRQTDHLDHHIELDSEGQASDQHGLEIQNHDQGFENDVRPGVEVRRDAVQGSRKPLDVGGSSHFPQR